MVELIGIFFLDSSLFPGTILLLLSFATSIPKTMASTTRANTNAAPTPAIINFLRFKTFTYAGSDVSGELFKSLAVRKKEQQQNILDYLRVHLNLSSLDISIVCMYGGALYIYTNT